MKAAGWVVKLGGSLLAAPELTDWLTALAVHGRGRLVVVPGGGAFADAVRAAQAVRPFADAAAHRMALLAMDQYAWMLNSLEPRLPAVAGLGRLRRSLRLGGVPLWLPAADLMHHPRLPASWEVTSDSLAAWLAGALGFDRVLLVKSVPGSAAGTPAEWVAKGWVDPQFPQFLGRAGAQAHLLGRAASSDLAQLLGD